MDNKRDKEELVSKGALGLLVGLSLMLAGFWAARQLHIVWNIWPSTDGVVVRGAVQEVLQAPYAKGGMPIHRYVPKIEFRYTVGGRNYTTEAQSVYIADTYIQAAANLARMYAPGSHHPIRYNPRDPRDIQFGIIEFGPLAFSLLLLVCGVVVSTIGLNLLVLGYSQGAEVIPAKEQAVPAPVLPFSARGRPAAPEGTLRCPACGRPVKATEDTCPNCLKFLRAA
ncbi:MAG: DUF3592 domain-containing protein [Terriglobia bacterium]